MTEILAKFALAQECIANRVERMAIDEADAYNLARQEMSEALYYLRSGVYWQQDLALVMGY